MAEIYIENLADGEDFELEISRATLNQLCHDIFLRCMAPLDRAMTQSGLSKADISEVVLVGGSTRIPKVREMLQEYFNGMRLNQTINPDEVVAKGAAIQAGIMQGSPEVADIKFTDVTPLSLGIRAMSPNSTNPEDDIMTVLIPKNTQIPLKETVEQYYIPEES